MSGIFVFDFDGVLVDSAAECYAASIKAFKKLFGVDVDSAEMRRFFIENRYLVRPPEHFCLLIQCFFEESNEPASIQFERKVDKLSGGAKLILDDFKASFLEARQVMKETDLPKWFALHRKYAEVEPLLKGLALDKFYVATMKDRASVMQLLNHYGLEILEQNLFDGSIGKNKLVHLQMIIEKCKAPPSEITFIDDSMVHLSEVAETGIKLCFASWGYSEIPPSEEVARMNVKVLY